MNFNVTTAHGSQSMNYSEPASFHLNSFDEDDYTMFEMSTTEEEKTVLFDHNAKIYRYAEKTKEWNIQGVEKIQIANVNNSNDIQLSLYSEGEPNMTIRQLINKDTQFNTNQMKLAVLTWIGQDSFENQVEKQQWAVKFNSTDICEKFYSVVLVATAVPGQIQANQFSSSEFMQQLLEFSATETPEEFKRRCANALKAVKVQQFWRNLQTWHEVNVSLGISTESQRRYYERQIGQPMNKN